MFTSLGWFLPSCGYLLWINHTLCFIYIQIHIYIYIFKIFTRNYNLFLCTLQPLIEFPAEYTPTESLKLPAEFQAYTFRTINTISWFIVKCIPLHFSCTHVWGHKVLFMSQKHPVPSKGKSKISMLFVQSHKIRHSVKWPTLPNVQTFRIWI